jgi:uncharacterized BrkB/YihY/UPF0761 family membrane protein
MTVLTRPSRIERDVDAPQRPGLGRILKNVRAEIDRDHISILAAGLAFYGLLSIFPGMSALISIYGLVADPAVIGRQVAALSEVLPQNALQLLSDQLHSLIAAPPGKLGIGLIISLALALWSAASGTGTLMQALTVAYEETNTRGIIAFYLRAIVLTIAIGIFGLISLFLIAVVPAVIDWLPISEQWRTSVALIRWPILAGLAFVALALVYPAVALVQPRHRRRRGVVADRFRRIFLLRHPLQFLRQDLWLARCGRGPADVALRQRLHRPRRRRAQFGDRETPAADIENTGGHGLIDDVVSLSVWISTEESKCD